VLGSLEVWTSAMTLSPQRATEQEPDAQADEQGRDGVALDQTSQVIHHAAEVAVLDVAAGLVQGAGDGVRGLPQDAAAGPLVPNGVGQRLHAVADGTGGLFGALPDGLGGGTGSVLDGLPGVGGGLAG